MFWAMIQKELKLVLKDKHALAALFVLPAIFILIMSVALRDQFVQNKVHFNISVTDLDKSQNSKKLIKKIKDDASFNVVETNPELVVVIPTGYYQEFKLSNHMKDKLKIIVRGTCKSDLIEIFKSKLLQDVIYVDLENIKQQMHHISPEIAMSMDSIKISPEELFDIKYEHNKNIPNSTQQSVPTWIVFGMFFIIIPMSTIFINERKQNTLMRLSTMNISIFLMTLSKIIPYLIINHIQLWIMLLVGIYVVPLFNAPALEINGSTVALVVLSVALSMSAIGLSMLIATSTNSSEQATTIGGILNILLGAIGGIMIPKFIMPEAMQKLADISPMSWGLDGFLNIFLKSGDITMVLDKISMLFLFGIICLTISMVILRVRIQKGW